MTRWFITGGDGFIGFHIQKLIMNHREDDKILSYDAHKHWISLDESKWPEYQQYRFQALDLINYGRNRERVKGDTTDRGRLKDHLEEFRPDIIIHLAALPIANVSNKYPTEAKRNILDGTITLMDVVRELDYNPKVVYISSSMVYGDFDKKGEEIVPAKETDSTDPLGLYGAMKLAGEKVVKAYHHRFSIPYVIIRPTAVYGPTDCNRRVTEIFMRNAIDHENLRLDNGGTHELDFTYVEDTARGIILASTKEEAENETFNIARGEGRSIKELAGIVITVFRKDRNIDTYEQETEVYRPNRGALNISKARGMLDYEPEYNLESGISEYYFFFKNRGEL